MITRNLGGKFLSCGRRHSLGFGRWIVLLAAALFWLLTQPSELYATPTNSPPRVLILDETVDSGTNSQEFLAAQLAIPGCAVDFVSAANLASVPGSGLGGPTGYGFDLYRAFIVGDPMCTGLTNPVRGTSTSQYLSALNALNATKTTWTPAMSGNIILEGVDNAFHAFGGNVGADKTLKRGIAFAVNDPNRTGFYYALSCYYDYTAPAIVPTLVGHLTVFGTFMVRNYPGSCFNDAHIVATHPVFTAAPPLTDFELSNWNCSTHEGFDVWPANFVVLAIALTNGTYTATDGSNGVPYILVRGEGVHVISSIDLTPPTATNNVGTTHTVCATIATNVFPRINVAVTFTIVSGPNAVTNFTTLTDSNGVACFTYTGNGGPGIDYITASYVNKADQTITSGTVAKTWENVCLGIDCETLECQADATWTYNLCVTNLTTNAIGSILLLNAPAGVTLTPGSFNFVPILGPGQTTNLTLSIASSNGPINFCFLLKALDALFGLDLCAIPHCITLPTCCNRVVTNTFTFVSGNTNTVSTYNYQITIQNISGSPIKYVGFAADQPCVTFLPPLINLTLPAYGGPSLLLPNQTRTLNVQVQKTAPCPGTNTFWLSTYTTNLLACCSTRLQLPKARCVVLISPYGGSVVLTNTPVLFKAIPNPVPIGGPCGFGIVTFYQDATPVGVADHDPYEVTVVLKDAGSYQISAVALLSSGEWETSDPAQLTVLAPAHDAHSVSLSAGVSGRNILLNVATELGHHYSIEYRTNLTKGSWQILQSFDGDGATRVVTDPMTNSARFYRSVLNP